MLGSISPNRTTFRGYCGKPRSLVFSLNVNTPQGTLPPRCTPAHAHAASASTEAPEHALLPALAPRLRWPSCSCAVRPGLDAGALGHDIAKPCKEGAKPVERQTPSALPSGAGRSGTAADLQERSDWRSPLTRGTGGDRKSWHGQSAAAPVLPAAPLGGR